MNDFASARRTMIDSQIKVNDVTHPPVLAALAEVPRERFVPEARRAFAYLDAEQPLGAGAEGRALMRPVTMARLFSALLPMSGEQVLEVGTATGYGAALLARIGLAVVALEESEVLVRAAQAVLPPEVTVVQGVLAHGVPNHGPYDVIVCSGAVDAVPPTLFDQLKPGGRLGAVVGRGRGARATLFFKETHGIRAVEQFDAVAPVLPGFARPAVFSL